MITCPLCQQPNPDSGTHCTRCHMPLKGDLPPPPPLVLPPMSPRVDPLIGFMLGHIRIEEKIASGGFGAVYRATHTVLEQRCAIKVLHTEHLESEGAARFKREAQALLQLNHPNIVRVNDFGTLPTGGFHMTMEFLEGTTLFQLIKAGESFSLARIRRICKQMCDALSYISSKGIVHRDLKPGNIQVLRDEKGREVLKLIDFGIASLLYPKEQITQTGAYIGTAKYNAPEQILGARDLDVRADLYALAVILYRLLTGLVPFEGGLKDVWEIVRRHLHEAPPRLEQTIPQKPWAEELEAFFQKALAKDKEDRYENPEAFHAAFARALDAQEELQEQLPGEATVLDTDLTEQIPESLRGILGNPKMTPQEKKKAIHELYLKGEESSESTREAVALIEAHFDKDDEVDYAPLLPLSAEEEPTDVRDDGHQMNDATVPSAPNPVLIDASLFEPAEADASLFEQAEEYQRKEPPRSSSSQLFVLLCMGLGMLLIALWFFVK